MLKLTKTGIGLLTKQYRSVLKKCLLLNLGLFTATAILTTVPEMSYSYSWNLNIGAESNADSDGATAVGTYSLSQGNVGVALGHRSYVYGDGSIAIGTLTVVRGFSSVALGAEASTSQDGVISVGHLASDLNYAGSAFGSDYFRRIVNVAEGSGANDAVTVSQLGNIAAGTKILNANGENAITFGTGSGQTTVGTALSTLANQLYNYYYTFRVDERVEAIEFAKELRSNKKEMSSLDFMPIKSSSDLRINLIKAEDPLTFSAKTRDDSLGLMEVCHA